MARPARALPALLLSVILCGPVAGLYLPQHASGVDGPGRALQSPDPGCRAPREEGGAGWEGPSLVPPDPRVHAGRSAPPEPQEHPDPARASEARGEFEVLVILIEFQDVKHHPSAGPGRFGALLFDRSEGTKSAHAYFKENSYGALGVTGNVTAAWYLSDHDMSYYGADGQHVDDANGPIWGLVTEAVEKADPDVDFSRYDRDGDGYIDHLCVVHAGQGQESSTDRNTIWSHRYHDFDEPSADGVVAGPYTMLSEFSPLGTFVHEFGHDLGLPDLYDYGYDSLGVGSWDLMAGGCWADEGRTPVHLSAFCKAKLGWLVPTDLSGTREGVLLPPVETAPAAFRLWISPPFEYFLIENRQQALFDAYLPAGGMLIWHVDEQVRDNNDQAHRMVDLEEADEAQGGDSPVEPTDAWHDSPSGFNPGSVPDTASYRGHPTGLWVHDIGPSGKTMAFSVRSVGNDVSLSSLDYQAFAPEKVPAAVRAVVSNLGASELRDLAVSCTVSRGDFLFCETRTVVRLGPGQSEPLQWSWTPPAPGNYVLRVLVDIEGDEVPDNDELAGPVRVTALLFFDDIESGPGGWEVGTNVPLVPGLWHVVNASDRHGSSFSPTHSWWCGYDRTGQYRRGADFIEHYLEAPLIDLTGVEAAVLVFRTSFDISTGLPFGFLGDEAYLECSSNLGNTWKRVEVLEGTSGGWTLSSVDITGFTRSLFTFRFVLRSNVLLLGKGWYIDDIAVYAAGNIHDVLAFLTPNSTLALPGSPVRFNLTVTNVGNRPDTYDLSWDCPEALSVELSSRSVELGVFQSARVLGSVRAGPSAEAFTHQAFWVSATSRANTRARAAARGEVLVLQAFDIAFECAEPFGRSGPGVNFSFSVNLTNPGNGPDTVRLSLGGRHAGMASLDRAEVAISAFATQAVAVLLPVPEDALSGTSYELELAARSSGGGRDTLPLNLTVDRVRGLWLSAEKAGLEARPNGTARFMVTLRNLGNGPDNCTLTSSALARWKVLHDVGLALRAFGEVTVMVEVRVPPDAPGGPAAVALEAYAPATPAARLVLTVEVVLPDLQLGELKIEPALADQGDAVSVRVRLTNAGTARASSVAVVLYDNGRKVREWLADLYDAGRSEVLTFTIRPGVGRHELSVIAITPDQELSTTNNGVQDACRVRARSGFIGGFDVLLAGLAIVGGIWLGRPSRRNE